MNKKMIYFALSLILFIGGIYFVYKGYNIVYKDNNKKDNVISQKIDLHDKEKVIGSENLEVSGLNIIATESGSSIDTNITNNSESPTETKCIKIIIKDETGNVIMEAFVEGIDENDNDAINSIHISSTIDLSKAYSYSVEKVK